MAQTRTVQDWPGYEGLDPKVWIQQKDAAVRYCIHQSVLSQNSRKLPTKRIATGQTEKVFFRVSDLNGVADGFQRRGMNAKRWHKTRVSVLGLNRKDAQIASKTTPTPEQPAPAAQHGKTVDNAPLERVATADIDKSKWISHIDAALFYCLKPAVLLEMTDKEGATVRRVQLEDGTYQRLYLREEMRVLAESLSSVSLERGKQTRDRQPAKTTPTKPASPAPPPPAAQTTAAPPQPTTETKDMPPPAAARSIDRLPASPEEALAMGLDPEKLGMFRKAPPSEPEEHQPPPEKVVRTIPPDNKLVPPPRPVKAWIVGDQLFLEKPEIKQVSAWRVGETLFHDRTEAYQFFERTNGKTTIQNFVGLGGDNLENLILTLHEVSPASLPDWLFDVVNQKKEEGLS